MFAQLSIRDGLTGLGAVVQSSQVRRAMCIAKGAFSPLGDVCFKTRFAAFTLETCILEESRTVLAERSAFVLLIQGRSQGCLQPHCLFLCARDRARQIFGCLLCAS